MSDLITRKRFSTTINKDIKEYFDDFIQQGNMKVSTICDEALVDIMVKYGYPIPEKFIKKRNMRFTDLDKNE